METSKNVPSNTSYYDPSRLPNSWNYSVAYYFTLVLGVFLGLTRLFEGCRVSLGCWGLLYKTYRFSLLLPSSVPVGQSSFSYTWTETSPIITVGPSTHPDKYIWALWSKVGSHLLVGKQEAKYKARLGPILAISQPFKLEFDDIKSKAGLFN